MAGRVSVPQPLFPRGYRVACPTEGWSQKGHLGTGGSTISLPRSWSLVKPLKDPFLDGIFKFIAQTSGIEIQLSKY